MQIRKKRGRGEGEGGKERWLWSRWKSRRGNGQTERDGWKGSKNVVSSTACDGKIHGEEEREGGEGRGDRVEAVGSDNEQTPPTVRSLS